jgi:hypothetical protein
MYYELDMNNLNKTRLDILDLPDEILLIILKELTMTDAVYSFLNVDQRFDRLVVDSLSIRDLKITNIMSINSLYNETSIDTKVLSKICETILPRIHHQIHKLTVEEGSMKAILLAGTYPQLYSLSLINIQEEILYQQLTGMTTYFASFKLEK